MKLTPSQIEALARTYCANRYEQDGAAFHWLEQIKIAEILSAWYYAFELVLGPSREMVEGDL